MPAMAILISVSFMSRNEKAPEASGAVRTTMSALERQFHSYPTHRSVSVVGVF
jgi:hypothetical protein